MHTLKTYKKEYGPTIENKDLYPYIIDLIYKYDGYVSEDELEMSISKLDLAYIIDQTPFGELRDALIKILDNSDPNNTECYLEIF